MIGTVFASPPCEINEMEIHIGELRRTHFLHSAPNGKRIRGGEDALRKREAHHGDAAPGERGSRRRRRSS
jgi:hypothetical protein